MKKLASRITIFCLAKAVGNGRVEEAKALMNEARDWSVWRWLMEERRVRETADRATEALGELEEKVKAGWCEELRRAAENGRFRKFNPELKLALEELKTAEGSRRSLTFGCRGDRWMKPNGGSAPLWHAKAHKKAIASWELREKAIWKAESIGRKK